MFSKNQAHELFLSHDKHKKYDINREELTKRRLPSYSQRSILSNVASEKYIFSARWSMARPFGVRMLLPMITMTFAPERDARMILGACSFQLVQNIKLKKSRKKEFKYKNRI